MLMMMIIIIIIIIKKPEAGEHFMSAIGSKTEQQSYVIHENKSQEHLWLVDITTN
jgi:hypothetical protein